MGLQRGGLALVIRSGLHSLRSRNLLAWPRIRWQVASLSRRPSLRALSDERLFRPRGEGLCPAYVGFLRGTLGRRNVPARFALVESGLVVRVVRYSLSLSSCDWVAVRGGVHWGC